MTMEISLTITETAPAHRPRAALVVRLTADDAERATLGRLGLLTKTLVPARFAERDVAVHDVLDQTQTFHFSVAIAKAVAAKIYEKAREIADDVAIELRRQKTMELNKQWAAAMGREAVHA